MLGVLGSAPVLCSTASGEVGAVARARCDERIRLRLVDAAGSAGFYIDDRRDGERNRLAQAPSTPIDRHATDDLTAITITEGLGAGVVVLTGSNLHGTVSPTVFERLTSNLRALGVRVIADLAGAELAAVRRGGVDVIKVSDEELVADGIAASPEIGALQAGAAGLAEEAGADVYVTCATGVLAATAQGRWWAHGPSFAVTEARGAGDSFTAAIAYGLRIGLATQEALRLGVATAASNVMRHGLGSGERDLINALSCTVQVDPWR
jgi:1-phosphofructokinase